MYPEYRQVFDNLGWNFKNNEPWEYFSIIHRIGECPFCKDIKIHLTPDGKLVNCLCATLTLLKYYEEVKADHGMEPPNKTLAQFEAYSDKQSVNAQLLSISMKIKEWVKDPSRWLLLYGTNGTGKSHLLASLYWLYEPVSIYINSSRINQTIHGLFASDERKELAGFISAMERIPILFIDDLGMENGKEWFQSILSNIIDVRYQHYEMYPTVISTNMSPEHIKGENPKVSSRLADKRIVEHISFTGLPDYRRQAQ